MTYSFNKEARLAIEVVLVLEFHAGHRWLGDLQVEHVDGQAPQRMTESFEILEAFLGLAVGRAEHQDKRVGQVEFDRGVDTDAFEDAE